MPSCENLAENEPAASGAGALAQKFGWLRGALQKTAALMIICTNDLDWLRAINSLAVFPRMQDQRMPASTAFSGFGAAP